MKRSALFAVLGLFLLVSQGLCEPEAVITVNGDSIYKDEFNDLLSEREDLYVKESGKEIDEAARSDLIKGLANDLIDDQLYIQEARRRGISANVFAGEEEIDNVVMRDQFFYKDGIFDAERYRKFTMEGSLEVKRMRQRAEELVLSEKRRRVVVPKVIKAIREDVNSDDLDVTDEYLNRAEKIKVAYLMVDPAVMANKMDVREEDLKNFYERNKELFTRPAVNEYTTLIFDPVDYSNMVNITLNMMKEYYAQHANEFKSERYVKARYVQFRSKDYVDRVIEPGVNLERYYTENMDKFIEPAIAHVYFISLKKPADPGKLKALQNEVSGGAPFSQIAEKYSDDATASRGGDMGIIKKGVLKEPFNGIAFSLGTGEVSGMIETDSGFYYLMIGYRTGERLKPLDEVRGEVESELLADQVKPLALSDATRFRVDAMNIGFAEAAKRKNMPVYETEMFTDGDVLPSIGKDSRFSTIAASLSTTEISPVIEYDDGFLVCMLSDERPQTDLSYESVSNEIESKLISEYSSIYANNAAGHSLDLYNEKVPLPEIEKRSAMRSSISRTSASIEATTGKIVKNGKDYSFTVLTKQYPAYFPAYFDVSSEVASTYALDKADEMAAQKIEDLRASGALTMEGVTITPPFARSDYVISLEYMKPFIDQCFRLGVGETGVVKSLGKFYLVRVVSKAVETSGQETGTDIIKADVLKEKREKHLQEWLKNEKERAEVQVNI